MDPLVLIFMLLALAVVLAGAELVVPSGGVLGILSAACFVGFVAGCFYINRWAGLGVFAASVVAAPFVGKLLFAVWERTPAGRAVVLNATTPPIEHEPIRTGDTGVTVSALRPMGEADFGPVRVQVHSEFGVIEPGTAVRVVQYKNGVATVRAV
jgi:membrane-bound serine protease (ClpP class)